MEVRLSKGLAEHISRASPNPLLRDLLAILVATTIARSRFSVHSLIIRRVVGSQWYREYLHQMRALPFINRCLSHTRLLGNISAVVAVDRWLPPARLRGLVRWEFSPEFASRLNEAFDWYLHEHDVTAEQVLLFDEILHLVGNGLEQLEPPDLTYDEVLEICDADEVKAEVNWRVLAEMHEGISGKCHLDFGHRVYHRLTNVKKEIRRLFRMNGEPVVEVDMHATFPSIIAAKLAPPGERERLIEMCQSGDFYGQMPELLGIEDRAQLKQRFQRDVVFTYRPHWSPIWQAFAREFPGTARALARIRDGTETVVDEHLGYDLNKRRYRTQTRWGQRRLSRILSRIESEIFLQRALVRLGREGIPAVPIHDCLMVAERHAELAQRAIEQAAREVLGFGVVVKASPSSPRKGHRSDASQR